MKGQRGWGNPDSLCRLGFSGLNSGTVIIKEWLVTVEVRAHETSTSTVKAAPAEVNGGTESD